ncbi:unnamed protein product [Coffea canephora]|uniref:DH200=94 genomic scaffold, scaffold_764 n=1 Tax=Coffea canephora TaxID=49390 RepID=A0A068VJN7_COFCA|nr:unnamed protein product [Coffea canephora]
MASLAFCFYTPTLSFTGKGAILQVCQVIDAVLDIRFKEGGVYLWATPGLVCRQQVPNNYSRITVPVGRAALGRIISVIGEAIDD